MTEKTIWLVHGLLPGMMKTIIWLDMIHTVAVIKGAEGFKIYNAGVSKSFENVQEALASVAKNPKTICILEVIE